jgi:hypothetical protein
MSDENERSAAMRGSRGDAVCDRITAYLSGGGLFNPEMANHDAVRDLLIDAVAEIERLRGYRDMAEADRVIAELAAERMRITAAERDAIEFAIRKSTRLRDGGKTGAALRGLLERLG